SFTMTDPSTTDIYTLSLHDALPIYSGIRQGLRLWGLYFHQRSVPRGPCGGQQQSEPTGYYGLYKYSGKRGHLRQGRPSLRGQSDGPGSARYLGYGQHQNSQPSGGRIAGLRDLSRWGTHRGSPFP